MLVVASQQLYTVEQVLLQLTSTTERSSSQRALDAGLSSTLLEEGHGSAGEPRDDRAEQGRQQTAGRYKTVGQIAQGRDTRGVGGALRPSTRRCRLAQPTFSAAVYSRL